MHSDRVSTVHVCVLSFMCCQDVQGRLTVLRPELMLLWKQTSVLLAASVD